MSTNLLLLWSRLAHAPPAMHDTLAALGTIFSPIRSGPSFPRSVPVSPVAPAARCKPCPVALVPTLGCSRPPARNLDLVRSARPGRIIREDMFILKTKRSLHFRTRRVIPQEKKHRFTQIEKVPTKKTFCVKLSIYFKKKSSPGIYTRCAKCTTV